MAKRENWVWMPHPGHFICGMRCKFRMNTYVGGYIVSTVGEMPKHGAGEDSTEWEEIGYDRTYETMVFEARKSRHKCCPWEIDVSKEVDMEGYKKPEDAYAGHYRLCKKWAEKGRKRR